MCLLRQIISTMNFFDAEDDLLIADIGHFESEQFTQELLLDIIRKKIC